MPNGSRTIRLWVTAVVLLLAFVLLHTVSHGEPMLLHLPLKALPYTLADWNGQELSIQEQIVHNVRVSDYTNRVYFEQHNLPVQLYVGYYASQRTGDTIHSPKNCLPGSGWDLMQSGYALISTLDGRSIVVNQDSIQKDQQKELVFYWYQGRGRVIANEYSGKFWMMVDAFSRNRTDGALVREITPMDDGEGEARSRLLNFTQILFPKLDALIPR